MATEVAYYTYMYAKVDRSKYQRVTGHARSAVLCGRFLSAVLGQALVTTQVLDLRQLNFISFGGKYRLRAIVQWILSLICNWLHHQHYVRRWSPLRCCRLSGASIYFFAVRRDADDDNANKSPISQTSASNGSAKKTSTISVVDEHSPIKAEFSYQRAFALLWLHFKSSYSNGTLIMWSVWWALGTCTMSKVSSYNLWSTLI